MYLTVLRAIELNLEHGWIKFHKLKFERTSFYKLRWQKQLFFCFHFKASAKVRLRQYSISKGTQLKTRQAIH